jgi:DNA-directed RNA polymerase
MTKEIHKLHQGGKLFHLKLRKAVKELSKSMDETSEWKPEWGTGISARVGVWLLHQVMEVCDLPVARKTTENTYVTDSVPVLTHSMVWRDGKQLGVFKVHPTIFDLLHHSTQFIQPWSLPMVVTPLPWVTPTSGGYITHRFPLVRTNGNEEQIEMVKSADEVGHLSTLMRSLDVLGNTPWRVNQQVFEVAKWFWNENVGVDCIPSMSSLGPEPIAPVTPPGYVKTTKNASESSPPTSGEPLSEEEKQRFEAELKKYRSARRKYDTAKANIFSERCSANYKLDIANAFLGQRIYFPHNVDFRGRAYPLPPHLNHMGDDLSRGLLLFDEPKKLGKRGLYWLHVHISNLYGFDKAPLDERYAFTVSNLEHIKDSALNPIEGSRWWLKGDKPWQLLASCIELTQAMESSNPEEFESRIPVHQDGSCNGLQHYAALGGDMLGAAAVNLVPSERPGDVYTQVSRRVQEKVDRDVEKQVPEALLMQHRINRKLVKQTVMTNTYGVTRIGARDQILSRLREARSSDPIEKQLSDEDMKKCAGYITTLVFESMGDLFTGIFD